VYIATNRFRVNAGHEEDFEELWRRRDTYLDQVPGFQGFHLLRGETRDGLTAYLSHSTWASRDAFSAWTKSEAFRKAHGDARTPEGTLAGHPVFEGFEVVL
jgi:heme-degrading monooxygenase HmoA